MSSRTFPSRNTKLSINTEEERRRQKGRSEPSPSCVSTPIVGSLFEKEESSRANTMMASRQGQKNKKKMIIKPFKKKPKLPDHFEEQTWSRLHQAIVAIQEKQQNFVLSFEELYQSVEDMCTWKMSEQLYIKLEKACDDHLGKLWSELVQKFESLGNGEMLLESYNECWKDHCEQILMIRSIFLYLDRTYVLQQNSSTKRSIWEMGLYLFRTHFFADTSTSSTPQQKNSIQDYFRQAMFTLIQQERAGENINRNLMYNLLRMLTALNLYHDFFELPFLQMSETFYLSEGTQLMEQMRIPEYLAHINKRLTEELERVVHYLDTSTRKSIIAVVEETLIQPHVSSILDKGFTLIVDGNRIEDLRRLYRLLRRVNALDQLKQVFNQYIRQVGSRFVQDIANESQLVDNLLKLKNTINQIWQVCFEKNVIFAHTIKDAMEYAVNVRQNRPAELLAKYVDSKLRSGNKSGNEMEMEQLLDQIMILFRYLQGKDIFEAFYKKDLAKRLLLGKSSSFELEKSMISKLKTECGHNFTSKLEGMFKDIDLSKDVMLQFQGHSPSRMALQKIGSNVDMSVQVLTTGFWPPYVPMDSMNIPAELAPYQSIFNTFYHTKYQGRRLQWHYALGHCIIRTNFPSGRKELAVSMYQTMVLLCFQDTDTLTLTQLKESTKMEDGELHRTLQSLACGKVRVLTKEPKGRDVNPGDHFHFNLAFTNKLIRIKINSIQMKETTKEQTDTHESVLRDRQYLVDAAIVRVMKSRKTQSHALLMSELFSQLKFPARPVDIKKRIESLIDREYLERDDKNPQVYNYLA